MVQVVLRDSTSISPDCSAVKRSLADNGTNLILLGSLKIAAAIARQMSTSRPVQLPLSSGEEKPGRPWLTPQDSMPRSRIVLSVCALAVCAEKAAATARVKTKDTRFMGKAFRGSSGEHCRDMSETGPPPMIPCLQNSIKAGQLPAIMVEQWIGGRGRPLNLQRRG